jgi:cytidyltransferase-like protein
MIKVFYSGTWDLFHYGHLEALKTAAILGDTKSSYGWLTVGVVTSDFARSFKNTPVIPYEQRAMIVGSLKCVNQVVPHRSWCDNIDLILEEGFDIRAIGPEHGGQHPLQLKVRCALEAAGIEYVVIPRTPNISTTLIKERIRNAEHIKV